MNVRLAEPAGSRGAFRRFSRAAAGFLLAVFLSGSVFSASPAAAQTLPPTPTGAPGLSPVPMLAYYYIWFDPSSWDRAKKDYPLLGRYSSSDPEVMRQHIRWAKEAGIRGFIVSWKSTDVLNPRLKQLIQIADEEDFKLSIIYQGLDFYRKPLPVRQIANDLDYFIENFAGDKAFDMFGKPLVIWSGTWEFSEEEIGGVTKSRRDRLLILASEKNQKGYERLAELVDGDAYYWSSVNPDTFKGYEDKLANMGTAIHFFHGLWIAPASVGFDARMIGGKSVVDRQDGQMLQRQIGAALQSSPDAVGLISWNEFSENSHIEPSQEYGKRYLDVLSALNNLPSPQVGEFDSSEPPAVAYSSIPGSKYLAIGGFLALALVSLGVVIWRQVSHRA